MAFRGGRDYKIMVPRASVKHFSTLIETLGKHYGGYEEAGSAIGVDRSALKRARFESVLSQDNGKKILAAYNKIKQEVSA